MRILILGGSGFVGSHLSDYFLKQGHEVTITSLNSKQVSKIKCELWDGQSEVKLTPLLLHADAVINLVGANIAGKRWTAERKQDILQSRILSCQALGKSLRTLHNMDEHFPKIIIQASACGFYGFFDDLDSAPLCTEDYPQGNGFLAHVCALWEQEMHGIESLGIRLCTTRFAPILGTQFDPQPRRTPKLGGFLSAMAKPFHFFVGGVVGSGKQPVPFVHINDVVCALDFLLHEPTAQGVFNVCSPQAQNMQSFTKKLAQTMKRPAFMPVPTLFIKLFLGEMAEELILSGQKVSPSRLTELGFSFHYTELEKALEQCFNLNIEENPLSPSSH